MPNCLIKFPLSSQEGAERRRGRALFLDVQPIRLDAHVVVGTSVPRIAEAVPSTRACPVLLKPISGRIVNVGAKILHKRLDNIVLEGRDPDINNKIKILYKVRYSCMYWNPQRPLV